MTCDDKFSRKRTRTSPRTVGKPEINPDEKEYYETLTYDARTALDDNLRELSSHLKSPVEPMRFRIMNLNVPIAAKEHLMTRNIDKGFTRLIETLEEIPFGRHLSRFGSLTKFDKIKQLRNTLDTAVTGHEAAKSKLIRNISRACADGSKKPLILGIRSPKGVGRGGIIDAIAKVMDQDVVRLDLRDCRVSGYIDGRVDAPGAIVAGLQSSKRMDPLFRIDNVDMSFTCDDTKDIDKAVLWLTDEKRNDKFRDKFLGDIDVDVSKCTFVFTYNLRQALHPVLLDRMIDVDLSRFSFSEKVNVMKKHVIPKTIERFTMCPEGIKIVTDDKFIKDCVSACPNTPGVYEVEQMIDTICEELEVSYVMDEAIPNVHEMISEYTTAHDSGIPNMMYT